MPSIVGGLDIHRKQVTVDYADLDTGAVQCGQIAPADREHFRSWLAGRFEHPEDVAFAVEACTGWRYVAGELAAAGITAHLAGTADTATQRGRKRRAKTGRADARLMRDLLAGGRLPECWFPPPQVLECRALLEAYQDLRREHTAWIQRVHAVLFHQGAPVFHDLSRADAPAELAALARARLSPAGQQQVMLCLRMLEVTGGELDGLRRSCSPRPATCTARRSSPTPSTRRAYHRARADLLAGRRRPLHLRPQGGPVRRAGHHRLLLRRQALTGPPVPAGPAGAALGGV